MNVYIDLSRETEKINLLFDHHQLSSVDRLKVLLLVREEVYVKQTTVANDSYRLLGPCNGNNNTRLRRRTTAYRLVLILKMKLYKFLVSLFQDNASDIHCVEIMMLFLLAIAYRR